MQEVFFKLLALSLTGSLFALAVMLVRLLFRKAPRWIFCALWGVVALRLILPFSIESNISIIPESIANGNIITSIGDHYVGNVDTYYESNAGYSNAVEAGRQPHYSDEGNYVVTEQGSLKEPATIADTVFPILSWVWITGMTAMLAYLAVSFLLLKRKMSEATLLRSNIWQCEQVDSPFVLGFIKPRIYLPYELSETDIANVIAHEQAHIQRKDHWWKPIGFLFLSIHWFNPILWVAYILLCRDIEAACDEKVIKHMEKDEMRAYSTALLNCSVHRRRIAACPLAFGEVGVKERIKHVMNYKKPAFWIIIATAIICIAVAVCFLRNPISNTLQTIDGYDLSIPNETTPVYVLEDGAYVYASAVDKEQILAFYDLRISRKEISQNRSEDRNKTHSLMIQTIPSDTSLLSSYLPGVYFHFNDEFTEVWANNEVKPTFTYKVKDPKKARAVYLSITGKSDDPMATIEGNLKTYYSMADGTWQYNGQTYQYRLEITGRMPNAAGDSTFVYLSNLKNITFARAWRAAGLSSNLEDYFKPEEAVLVEWIQDDPVSTGGSDSDTLVNKPDTKLDAAISDAILSHHMSENTDGLLNTESHIILVDEIASGTPLAGQTGHIREETVYVYYLYLRFHVQEDHLEEHNGIYGQAAITFTVDENEKYTLKHFVKPESSVDSGADYSTELKNKFVAASEDIAENEEKYSEQLLDSCWATATDYLNNQKAASTAQPGGTTATPLIDSISYDIDGDGQVEMCTLIPGPTSGLFSFCFYASPMDATAAGAKYSATYVLGVFYELSFVFSEDGDLRIKCENADISNEAVYIDINVNNNSIILQCEKEGIFLQNIG